MSLLGAIVSLEPTPAPSTPAAPRLQLREFDAARFEQTAEADRSEIEASIQAYERAKIVSQTVLDYQVCV